MSESEPRPAVSDTPDRGPLIGRQGWHFRDCWQFFANGLGDAKCICSGAALSPEPEPVAGLDVETVRALVEEHVSKAADRKWLMRAIEAATLGEKP